MGRPYVFIDGDILAYRAAFGAQEQTEKGVNDKLDELMEDVLAETTNFAEEWEYQVFLTGKGNFRFPIAKTALYKGNRGKAPKPPYIDTVRMHITSKYAAIVSENEEADDLIGIAVSEYGPSGIVVTIDKDMKQLPCRLYNPSKRTWETIDYQQGLRFFYTQILTGDAADNIIGLTGIGPVKAEKLLANCITEEDMFDVCVEAYGSKDRVLENGNLLWLRRKPAEIWSKRYD